MKNFTNHYYKALMLLLVIPFMNACSTQTALNTHQLEVESAVTVTTPAAESAAPIAAPVEVKTPTEVEIREEVKIAEAEISEAPITADKPAEKPAVAPKKRKAKKAAEKLAGFGEKLADVNPVTKTVMKKADKIASKITKKQGITGNSAATQEGGGLLYTGVVLLIAGILVGIIFDRLGYALSAVGVVLIIVWVLLALL